MLFGRKNDKSKERPPFNPRGRMNLYALCGLYLGYLLYQLVDPHLWGGEPVSSVPVLLLGVAVLGGGMVLLFYLAWKMYRMPVPTDEEPGEEPEALLDEALSDDEAEPEDD